MSCVYMLCAFLVFVCRVLPHFSRAILDYSINTIVDADRLVLLFLVCRNSVMVGMESNSQFHC